MDGLFDGDHNDGDDDNDNAGICLLESHYSLTLKTEA